MNKKDKAPLKYTERDVVNWLFTARESSTPCPFHPSAEVLRAYVEKSLPKGLRKTDQVLKGVLRGDLLDWHQQEAGIHIRMCDRCSDLVATLRAEASSPRASFLEKLKRCLKLPGAAEAANIREGITTEKRLVNRVLQSFVKWILGPFTVSRAQVTVVALVAGFFLGLLLMNVEFSNSTSPSLTDAKVITDAIDRELSIARTASGARFEIIALRLLGLLQDAGLDLRSVDFHNLLEYSVQPHDTLNSIALSNLGDSRLWPILYILNHDDLMGLERFANSGEIGDVQIHPFIQTIIVARKSEK